MKKKMLVLALAMALVMTACGGDNEEEKPTEPAKESQGEVQQETEIKSSEVQPEQQAKESSSLEGEWKQTNNDSEDAYMIASISDKTIILNWVSDNGDTKTLFWYGSFEKPETDKNEYSWTSVRDQKKMESAVLASEDETMDFHYKDGELSFESSMMGITTITRMKKVN